MKCKKILILTAMMLISCGQEQINSSSPRPNISIINPFTSSEEISSIETSVSSSEIEEISINSSNEEEISSFSSFNSSEEKISDETSSQITSSNDYDGYYALIDFSKTGDSLKQDLYNLIKKCDMSKYTYNTCDSYIANANEDPNNPNNLIEFYTGRSVPKNYYPTSSSKPDAWNKEHVFAKSHGGFESEVAGKDIHHLMPTDNGVNNNRSSKNFDDCTSEANAVKTYKSYGQTITITYANPNDICYSTSTVFEPRDAVKGDVARILFYMATRYEGNSDGGPDLELVDSYPTGSAPTLGKLSTLKKWHELDPVDDFEMQRNNYIYSIQNNRNPYIDHPELVAKIF